MNIEYLDEYYDHDIYSTHTRHYNLSARELIMNNNLTIIIKLYSCNNRG